MLTMPLPPPDVWERSRELRARSVLLVWRCHRLYARSVALRARGKPWRDVPQSALEGVGDPTRRPRSSP